MVVAQPESGLPIADGQSDLPASWPGLRGVSVWSPFPRCPAESRPRSLGCPSLPPLQNRRRYGVPSPDGSLPLSVVVSFSEKGMEEFFLRRGAGR